MQHGQCESDGQAAAVALLAKTTGAVHLLAYVLGDRFIQILLRQHPLTGLHLAHVPSRA